MYPNNKKCLCKETMGSHTKAVIGILVITIVFAFGLYILGVWGCNDAKNGVQTNIQETPFVPDNKPLEDKISEDKPSGIKTSKEDVYRKDRLYLFIEEINNGY